MSWSMSGWVELIKTVSFRTSLAYNLNLDISNGVVALGLSLGLRTG